jgi:WD40 repeat protein
VTGLALAPDGKTLAVAVRPDRPPGQPPAEVVLWDLATGQRRPAVRPGASDDGTPLAFTPTGQTLATGDREGVVRLWDAEAGLEQLTLRQAGGVSALEFAPDGRALAAGSVDGSVTLWYAQPARP